MTAIAGPSAAEPLRPPTATRLRLPRPTEPELYAEIEEPKARLVRPRSPLPQRRSLVPITLLVLVIAGTVGAAGWAWRTGVFDRLLPDGRSVADRTGNPPAEMDIPDEPRADQAGAQAPQNGEAEPSDGGATEVDAEADVAAIARVQEIERLSRDLERLSSQLGGPPGIEVEEQLASAETARATGEADEAAGILARLQDGLRAQVAAAQATVTARQRLSNAGPMAGESRLSRVAAAHVERLANEAGSRIDAGDYATAADRFEQALDARLRLPREAESLEEPRATAEAAHTRVAAALEELDFPPAGEVTAALSGAELLSGEGALVEDWLSGNQPATALAGEYERLSAGLETAANRLERVLSLRNRMHADLERLAAVETEVSELVPQPEQLASWLEAGPRDPDSEAQEGATALAAGKLEEAVLAYESAAAEAAQRLEAAEAVRDLVVRSAKARDRVEQEVEPVLDRLADVHATLVAWSGRPGVSANWSIAADRVAGDLGRLQALSAAARQELPAQPQELEDQVSRGEAVAGAAAALAPAIEALANAELRLLLVRQITAEGAEDPGLPESGAVVRQGLADITANGVDEAQVASATAAYAAAAAESGAAADALAGPAADALATALADRQQRYRREFGKVDLRRVWQPQDAAADLSGTAQQVEEALGATADAAALRTELSSGRIDNVEVLLGHVRGLDEAMATIQALHEAAEQADEEGRRQLHRSAVAGNEDEVRSLLALAVSPAPRDEQGRTPVGLALSAGHAEVARLLLATGGRPENWIEEGRPIVFVAAASPASLRLLLENGAPALDLHRGETALHALAWQANREQVPADRQIESAKILLGAGVDRTVRNRSGATAAELATSLGLAELAEYLRTARDEPQDR